MGGSKGRFYKTVKDTKIDYLFVVTADKDLYLIPNSLIKNKYTYESKKSSQTKINFFIFQKIVCFLNIVIISAIKCTGTKKQINYNEV